MRSVYVKSAFLMLTFWWVYLFFTTQFVVVFDSTGYEDSGKMILQQGWAEFLRHGPQREPMFPGIVALSMRLGEWWGVSYHYPLKMIGLLFLLLTMIFSYRLMRMLGIQQWIAGLFVFYLGISPTMTTSSLRLWSEFAAYPWVVLAVIWTIKSWRFLGNAGNDRQKNIKVIGHALMVAIFFLCIMAVKAVAEGILLFYLWPFYWQIFSCWRSGNLIKARQVTVFCLVVLLIFEGAVCAYKASNYHYNGQYAFTNRGDWAFYGNTARRMQPLTPARLGAAVATVPGTEICSALFKQDDCNFWTARYSDDMIAQKRAELDAKGVTGDAATRYFINSSLQMILSNPLQAMLLMFVEAHKMFFWEPIISFEVYPDWLSRIFFSPQFVDTVLVITAFSSWASCVFAFFYLCRRYWKPVLSGKDNEGALMWVFNFVFWYMAMYSLFFVLDRYAFPLIALYIVLAAFLADKITRVFVR